MENKYCTIKKNKHNSNFLKDNGFKKLKSAIYNSKSETVLLINREKREFWETCLDGITDASRVVLESENQEIQTLKSIESCLN